MGKPQSCVMGARSCPGGCKVSPVSLDSPAGAAQGGSAARENLLLPFRAQNQMGCSELALLGAHPSAPTLPELCARDCGQVFGGCSLAGNKQEEGPAAGPCCSLPPIPARAGEGVSGRTREGKDVSNQSYLNKSLFGPRALLKAAYLIKSPIFHIYGPYSVKY